MHLAIHIDFFLINSVYFIERNFDAIFISYSNLMRMYVVDVKKNRHKEDHWPGNAQERLR